MHKQIIPANHHLTRKVFKKDGDNFLNVSEMYCDTIQGEGVYLGVPSIFLRLKGCTLNCNYCDTTEVWRYGTPWSFNELFDLMEEHYLPRRLKDGEHLVITGGSPLLQQEQLGSFFRAFMLRFGITPFVEIENECVLMPTMDLIPYVDCWNNSPKLLSSGMAKGKRYFTEVIIATARLSNSWFKFVITDRYDWNDIQTNFGYLLKREQIILMPEGKTREELKKNEEMVLNLAIEQGVRYSPRLHIMLWNDKKGV